MTERTETPNVEQTKESGSLRSAVDALVMPLPCICEGNWRNIIAASTPLFGKKFRQTETGLTFIFCGVMHGEDDYYYCMWRGNDMHILSCVGSIEAHGYIEA